MLLTFVAGIGGLILPAVAVVIGLPATWLLRYMVNVAEYLAGLPWAVSKIDMKLWIVGIYYLVVIIICIYMWRVTKFNLRDSNLVE